MLYVPESPVNLIRPQKCAQESAMKEDYNKGTFFCDFGDEFIYVWNKQYYIKTVSNDPTTNLPVLQCKDTNEDIVQSFTDDSAICLECN